MENDLPIDAVKFEGRNVRIILDTLRREEHNFCSEYCMLPGNPKNPRITQCPFNRDTEPFRPLKSLGAINSFDYSPRKKELFNDKTKPFIDGKAFFEGIAIPRLKGTIFIYPARQTESLVYTVGEVKVGEVLDVVKIYANEIHEEMSRVIKS